MRDNKVKNIVVLNGITLESAEVDTQAAADRVIVDTYFSDRLNFSVKYITGASEVSTNAYIKVWGYIGTKSEGTSHPYSSNRNTEIAEDEDNWIQIGEYSITGGTATFVPTLYEVAGGAGGTTYNAHFSGDITFSKIRFSAYEDGTPTNKGSMTVVASVQ